MPFPDNGVNVLARNQIFFEVTTLVIPFKRADFKLNILSSK